MPQLFIQKFDLITHTIHHIAITVNTRDIFKLDGLPTVLQNSPILNNFRGITEHI